MTWLSGSLFCGWMKNIRVTDWMSTDTRGLAAINLALACCGAYAALTMQRPDSKSDSGTGVRLSEGLADDTGSMLESEPLPRADWLVAFFGSAGFLISACLNFFSFFLVFPRATITTTGSVTINDANFMAVLEVQNASVVAVVADKVRTIPPPDLVLQSFFIVSGAMNIASLVGIYRWLNTERKKGIKRAQIRVLEEGISKKELL